MSNSYLGGGLEGGRGKKRNRKQGKEQEKLSDRKNKDIHHSEFLRNKSLSTVRVSGK